MDTFLLYQTLFENSGDLLSILHLPYPLYTDVILKQVEEKKKEKRMLDERMRQMQAKSKRQQPVKRR
ncbi:MAG TPA: hypothetical protein PLL26_07325 [Candidatus Dojkabacteria bacterium]|nr:hypothetical protein [Candidatus Dojkabacteria bacterium]